MRLIHILTIMLVFCAINSVAELLTIPAPATGQKKLFLFSDDFSKSAYGDAWQQVVPTFT